MKKLLCARCGVVCVEVPSGGRILKNIRIICGKCANAGGRHIDAEAYGIQQGADSDIFNMFDGIFKGGDHGRS